MVKWSEKGHTLRRAAWDLIKMCTCSFTQCPLQERGVMLCLDQAEFISAACGGFGVIFYGLVCCVKDRKCIIERVAC